MLYVGAGSGEDVVAAAERGFEVAALDRSPRMLARLRKRLAKRDLEVELIEADLLEHEARLPHDVVVANFFLNVFDRETVDAMLRRCREATTENGLLLIGDFRPPGRRLVRRLLYNTYYAPLNLVAWALGLCVLHPIYDYEEALERAGYRLVARHPQALSDRSPAFYETLVARAR